MRLAYLATDEFIARRCATGGAAAATFYLTGDRFLATNAGDAMIVIGTGALSLTVKYGHLGYRLVQVFARRGDRVVVIDAR